MLGTYRVCCQGFLPYRNRAERSRDDPSLVMTNDFLQFANDDLAEMDQFYVERTQMFEIGLEVVARKQQYGIDFHLQDGCGCHAQLPVNSHSAGHHQNLDGSRTRS